MAARANEGRRTHVNSRRGATEIIEQAAPVSVTQDAVEPPRRGAALTVTESAVTVAAEARTTGVATATVRRRQQQQEVWSQQQQQQMEMKQRH